MRSRVGSPKAITAVAHELAKLVYRMLKYGEEYVKQGAEEYETLYRERRIAALRRNASALGFRLEAQPAKKARTGGREVPTRRDITKPGEGGNSAPIVVEGYQRHWPDAPAVGEFHGRPFRSCNPCVIFRCLACCIRVTLLTRSTKLLARHTPRSTA